MSAQPGVVYEIGGNKNSEQAEASTSNRGGGTLAVRTLVELQLISFLLHQQGLFTEDLAKMRQDISDSIT
jgi:hypothetical protein